MHILLLEDDSLIRSSLTGVLAEFGHVHPVKSLRDAYETLESRNIDIALIDRRLPDGDGTELVEHLQAHCPHTKSILVTSMAGLPDRLEGWRMGADDYIAKPFSREEVRLRVMRLTRLNREAGVQWERFGGLRFNKLTGDAFVGKMPLYLRPKEFAIFLLLWRNRDHIVAKQHLVQTVWGLSDHPNPSTIGVYVRRLRMNLKPAGLTIQTFHRHGYKLIEGKSTQP